MASAGRPRPGTITRIVVVGLVSVLATIQVVRTAVLEAAIDDNPALAGRAWPSHPRVRLARAMAGFGAAAIAGKTPPARSIELTRQVARQAPLAAEPFVITGAIAQTRHRPDRAERLFVEARRRDPRAAAARYFLAERFLATGRAAAGLVELTALARLVPGGPRLIVPAIVSYARGGGSPALLKPVLAANRDIADGVLGALAADPANAELVMAIAPLDPKDRDPATTAWQARLLEAMIAQGRFDGAHRLWARLSGQRPPAAGGVFNAQFRAVDAPPPFNWALAPGAAGVSEPAPGGGLHLLYYGRDAAELASQLLMLPAGTYELRMKAFGDLEAESGLQWTLRCAVGGRTLAALSLRGATLSGTPLAARFAVPPGGCPAQWLKLVGKAGDFARSEDAIIRQLELVSVDAP